MTAERTSILGVPVEKRDHIQGPSAAAVTLVEYGDYECPQCREACFIVKDLQAALGNQLRLIFRNFPLANIHPHAQHAAEAAEAAAAQNKFWEMHDWLYDHQAALSDRHLKLYATQVGLDMARFNQDLVTHSRVERVREDFMGGVRSGVTDTPTFFINAQRHNGRLDPDSLLAAINAAA